MKKKPTLFVDGPYGIAEGRVIWMVERDIVFWCREELRLGSKPRARLDIGTGQQVDIEIHVREHLVPEITQIPKGFVFVGRYSMVSGADEASLYKVLRSINRAGMSGGEDDSSSYAQDSSRGYTSRHASQSYDSSSGLQKQDSQELLMWHLGRRKMRSKKTTGVGRAADGGPQPRERGGPATYEEDASAAPEPTDPAERMRVAREALKETATDRRPLFESQDDMASPEKQADGAEVGQEASQQQDGSSSSESSKPLKRTATRSLPSLGKAPPRKGKAHRALKDAVGGLRARATGEESVTKKANESSSFGFKRDFTTKKRRTRKQASPASEQNFTNYVTGTIAPGTASVLIQFPDPGKLLACMKKQGSRLWFSVHMGQQYVVGTTFQILLKLPDSTMTQFQGRICEVHDTHSVLAVENADSTQIDAIRIAMELD